MINQATTRSSINHQTDANEPIKNHQNELNNHIFSSNHVNSSQNGVSQNINSITSSLKNANNKSSINNNENSNSKIHVDNSSQVMATMIVDSDENGLAASKVKNGFSKDNGEADQDVDDDSFKDHSNLVCNEEEMGKQLKIDLT